jgi:hypothetical protein
MRSGNRGGYAVGPPRPIHLPEDVFSARAGYLPHREMEIYRDETATAVS